MEHCTGVTLLALALLAVCAQCKWVLLDPCDERCECECPTLVHVYAHQALRNLNLSHVLRAAHPDGSDIMWPIEMDDSNGTVRYRYPLGPPPFGTDLTNSSGNSSGRVSEAGRTKRAATSYRPALWPGGIVPYHISAFFTGGSCYCCDNGFFYSNESVLSQCRRFHQLSYTSPFSHLHDTVEVEIYIDCGRCATASTMSLHTYIDLLGVHLLYESLGWSKWYSYIRTA